MADILFMPRARRQWRKLSPSVRSRIEEKLELFADFGLGDVTKMKGQDGSRLRVGDWRLIFYHENQSIIVVSVGHRREVYD